MGSLRWRVLLSLIYTMTFCVLSDAQRKCPEGKRIHFKTGQCGPCPTEQYQPVENYSTQCLPCTKCDPKFWSVRIQNCTKTENVKCKCLPGFVPSEDDSATCKCADGFGVTNNACSECEDGYFCKDCDSPCSKWKECKSTGVKVNGTSASDVICNDELKNGIIATPATSNKSVSVVTRLVTRARSRIVEHVQTQEVPQHSTTTSPPSHEVSTKVKQETSSTDNSQGMAVLVTLGIVGLIILSAVTCKLNIIPHIQNKNPPEDIKDSLYRRPVEESGDSSCSTPLEP